MARHFKELDCDIYVADHVQFDRKALIRRLEQRVIGRDFGRLIDKGEYELLYSEHAFYAAQFKLNALMKRKHIPHIVRLNGDWWTEFASQFRHSEVGKKAYMMQSYVYQWYGLASANECIPICKWLEAKVNQELPRLKTEVVYQGVDPEIFSPCQPALTLAQPSVAIIQNHVILPKVQALISMRPIIEKCAGVHFYIANGQEIGYLASVKEAFGGLENVHFMNVRYPDGVRNLLSSCDAFLLRSNLDCCPTALLEAGIMNKPVIASKVGGIPEIVKDGQTGFVLDNESDQWYDRILRLTHERDLAAEMGRRAREYILNNFVWAQISRQVERIILDNLE